MVHQYHPILARIAVQQRTYELTNNRATNMEASIIIRTYNEQRHLPELLTSIKSQETEFAYETIIVDSGSTDDTLEIARKFDCRILGIAKHEFTFGRSLNVGCEAATGKALVFISGHCVPCERDWLARLIEPLRSHTAHYTYGRQVGHEGTKFSEDQVFSKYFPTASQDRQDGFFCNNANAAVSRVTWSRYRFDEELTGLEDLRLAMRHEKSDGGKFIFPVSD